MKKFIRIIVLIGLISSFGCQGFKLSSNDHLKNDVKSVTTVVNTSAQEILDSSKNINNSVTSIKQNTIVAKSQINTEDTAASAIVVDIEKSADQISEETRKLRKTSLNLSQAGVKLEISGRTLDDYVQRASDAEKANEKLEKENLKLNENIKSGLNRMLKWIVGGCLIGAGACAAMAMFFGNVKGGLFGATACIAIMVLAIAVGQYMMYIAIAGVCVIVATLGVLGYQLLIQRRAISDNVWTQEVAKKIMPIEVKEKIYGAASEKGEAGKIQSATTQKIVKQIKDKMPNGWKSFKKEETIGDISS